MADVPDYTRQPAPIRASTVESAHDRVIADLRAAYPEETETRTAAIDGLLDRKAYGLAKYQTVLHPGNGRDHLQDGLDETEDQLVYLRTAMDEDDTLVPYLWVHFQQALALLMKLRWLIARRTAETR
jgi:hypothetical protein